MAVIHCSNCHNVFEEVPPGRCGRCGVPTAIATAPPRQAPPPPPQHESRFPPVTLMFPWGEHMLNDGDRLNLGRDPDFSPLAERLASYECVSREHAVIVFSDGSIWVHDEGSTNGTAVDDEPLIGTAPRRASGDATVALAGVLAFTLRRS